MIRSLTIQKKRLLVTRIFAGVMLFVWFGNSVPPLMAMTLPADACQMSCCQVSSSTEDLCLLMAEMTDSHKAMPDIAEPAEEQVVELK